MNSRSSGQPKNDARLFSTLHPLSTVIFATATVLAFVLLCNSRFNFHCYTQHEAASTQKSARKCTETSRDFLHERLQSAFTRANHLCWIAQYCFKFHPYWAVQAGLLTPLIFTQHHLCPLAVFTSSVYFLHNGRRWQWICKVYNANFKVIFEGT